MLQIKSLILGCLLGLVILCYVLPATVSAQTTKPAESAQADRDQTLRQLLTEVRELRLELQRAMVTNGRFQMLIERLKAQQGQVDSLGGQLAGVRSELAKLKAYRTQAATEMKDMEDRLGQSSGEQRMTIEKALKEGKLWLESKATEEQRQVELEANLSMRLQIEQGRLDQLSSQLDALLTDLKVP